MFSALRRSSRLLRIRTTANASITNSSTGALTLLQHAPAISASPAVQQQRSLAISAILRNASLRDNRGAAFDTTAHAAILEDSEHEVDVESTIDEVTKFQHLADKNIIDTRVIKNITDGMKYEDMTKVQRKTVLSTVTGVDVLAQAKTGTGKTIAFLLPAIQRVITSPEPIQPRRIDVRTIIISPTRELALQIQKDALKLCAGTGIVCQSAVGGTGKSQAVNDMRRNGCHILIATPGRLHDLLQDQYVNLDISKVDTLVLDEGDTLLDQGFSDKIAEIVRLFPGAKSNVRNGEGRQSMVFSATMPQKVLDMVRKTLRPDYKFLKMVEKGEAAVHTRIKQHLVECNGFENMLPALYELVMRESGIKVDEGPQDISSLPEFKAVVFCPTTKFANIAAATFQQFSAPEGHQIHPFYSSLKMVEIHSRLTQPARSKASERFKMCKRGILFASDVVARGMDFPNVTHVIQLCAPSNQEQYIHRLGRTGRAGKDGVGYLMLSKLELGENAVKNIVSGMNMDKDHGLETADILMDMEQKLTKPAAAALTAVTQASIKIDDSTKSQTYVSMLGYFNGLVRSKQNLVDAINRWTAVGWAMPEPPSVSKKLIQQIGLGSVKNLNTKPYNPEEQGSSGGFGGRGGSAGRGGFGGRGGRGGFGGDRPQRSFGDRDGGDRPQRSFGDRPSRSFGDREGGDRPRRSFGDRDGGDRPQRSFGDRPSRGSFGGRGGGRGGFGGDRGDRPPYERRERPSFSPSA
ncbi:Similar to ATP-dependent RNA helicase mss116, mitochondrial; acc. no. Q4WRP2 [Pyronema omphalodes CBS 100304]|uniref:ATP-dependent RNA helicase n=1 Tax=Pyronema omphalodes (strain CBS 100304) TaxID=1076935 RepID=U4L374_PYROM|nr:Similar to ATP-dependent RNA helicase mss116, mitochondrial; acc. no. Q4WRP2 [Pyronema omphalodes CBS 100304]